MNDYDSTKFWLYDGVLYMDGTKNSKGVSFEMDADGKVTFHTVAQSVTTLKLDVEDETFLYENRPDNDAPNFTMSNGVLAVSV